MVVLGLDHPRLGFDAAVEQAVCDPAPEVGRRNGLRAALLQPRLL
jgi:hypothetical protein